MSNIAGGRVLVIDANIYVRRMIATLLTALSVDLISEARFPGEVRADSPAPHLIIVDWTADPIETTLFAHRVRRGELYQRNTPILATASSLDHPVLEQAWRVGIDDVIGKPISAVELIQRSAALLDERWTWLPTKDMMAAE